MKTKSFWQNSIFIILGLVCVISWYLYSSQITNFWNKEIAYLKDFSVNSIKSVKNCGTSVSPKMDSPIKYKDDAVLSCLGDSAVSCQPAKGYLNDSFFPTVFEITKTNNSCNFKLSYTTGSTLSDITGKKLAGQYITCPLSVVKNIDDTNPTSPKFTSVDKTNSSKYGSQIYLYGTIGLFVENGLNQNKISAIGCSGDYIKTMIASSKSTEK